MEYFIDALGIALFSDEMAKHDSVVQWLCYEGTWVGYGEVKCIRLPSSRGR